MTPREYYRDREAAPDLVMAWRSAAFFAKAMAGNLPSLETMLNIRVGPRRSSREEQWQMFHFLSERYQIPLKVVH